MPISMSVIQNEHGVFVVRKKVPKKLEEAAAVVTAASKPRVAFLQRSLRTKDKREARRLAPPVLMEFERVLAEAEALLMERPMRSELDLREIERIASFFYVSELAADEEGRRESRPRPIGAQCLDRVPNSQCTRVGAKGLVFGRCIVFSYMEATLVARMRQGGRHVGFNLVTQGSMRLARRLTTPQTAT